MNLSLFVHFIAPLNCADRQMGGRSLVCCSFCWGSLWWLHKRKCRQIMSLLKKGDNSSSSFSPWGANVLSLSFQSVSVFNKALSLLVWRASRNPICGSFKEWLCFMKWMTRRVPALLFPILPRISPRCTLRPLDVFPIWSSLKWYLMEYITQLIL